jgi:hypothetical protein
LEHIALAFTNLSDIIACWLTSSACLGADNPHLIYTLVQYEPKIQTMATFTLQRGLDDIHKLRYQRMEALSTRSGAATSENSGQFKPSGAMDNRSRRPVVTRQQSIHDDGNGESSSSSSTQQHPTPVHMKRWQGSKRENAMSATGTSAAAASSSETPSSSLSFSPTLSAEDLKQEAPIVMPTLLQPESSDSFLTPQSDGGGHEGDVEDEGGPSTVLKSPKERSLHVQGMSEKARGKLPEKHHQQSSIRPAARTESSCELEREEESIRPRRMSNPSKTASSNNRRHPSSAAASRGSNHRQEPTTTAYDVGQNGFVPTDAWVRGAVNYALFHQMIRLNS